MQIEIAELKRIADRLFAHLLENDHATVEIPHDYYWAIPKPAVYDPYTQPTDLTLGQLTFDLEDLRLIALGETEPIGYAFVWLAAILKAVGEESAV
jgi:hypothetical protein